ncbi:MAG TPA: HypC/HybG/HupF family hydrogenase formation chaperone [Deltaproteobacteria bacterium]|nr:HypC/HybG/HupF family hydrogenase formation chaperone [Deltaproteobacteria bacterium]
MCLAVPGKVVELGPAGAVVDVAGTRREASTMLVGELSPGDYVIVHAGFVIEKLDAAEAEKTLSMIDELIGSGR